jgi:5-methyltetrahydropteroyltriglutamate--homocysteine methyltransferase
MHVEAVNHALRGISPDSVRHHTCYGLNHGPRMNDIPLATAVPFMLAINAGAYSFEVANPRHYHEWHIWENVKLRDDKILIPGLIGHATNYVEHPELIADYIVKYANLVGRENVIAAPDCGFGTFGGWEPRVHPEIMWAKFGSLVEGARIASGKLWGKASVA